MLGGLSVVKMSYTRSLMNDNALMLVVASRKELSVYGSEYRFVSQFFTLGHFLKLGELPTG
jgi:hypothetical protein